MGARHRKTWVVVREGAPTSSGYQATLARLDSDYAASTSVNGFAWIVGLLSWLGPPDSIVGFEPRYRVLLRRIGSDESNGVAQARSRERAEWQFAQVEEMLAHSTDDEIRARFDLDF